MGYLICDKCGGHYELKSGESPEDFVKCECGGALEYVENLDNVVPSESLGEKASIFPDLKDILSLRAIFIGSIVVLILAIIITEILSKDVNQFASWNDGFLINNFMHSDPQDSLYIPFAFIGALVTGYFAGRNPIKGIFNGVIAGLIATIIAYIVYKLIYPDYTGGALINNLDIYVILISMFIGAISGFLGIFFKANDPIKTKIELEWKPTIIFGLLISIVLGLIFNYGLGWFGIYGGVLFGTVYTGYKANKNYNNAAIHGTIVGIITALLLFGVLTILSGAELGIGSATVMALLTITEIIVSALIGAVGGIIGILIKESDKIFSKKLDGFMRKN
jgi:H+/Cl- antiporter ClcA